MQINDSYLIEFTVFEGNVWKQLTLGKEISYNTFYMSNLKNITLHIIYIYIYIYIYI